MDELTGSEIGDVSPAGTEELDTDPGWTPDRASWPLAKAEVGELLRERGTMISSWAPRGGLR